MDPAHVQPIAGDEISFSDLSKPPTQGLKLLMWAAMPSIHQSFFYEAIRQQGMDLVVHYFGHLNIQRIKDGWSEPEVLPAGEIYVGSKLDSLFKCPDWRERIHVLPGYNRLVLLRLAVALSKAGVAWVHWSEASYARPRHVLTQPIRRFYARLVNRRALGALAIGDLARFDFVRWGIENERIHFLPYSVPAVQSHSASVASGARRELPRFLFLGSLYPIKGIDVLLNAFERVVANYSDAKLILVGHDRENGRYLRQANKLGLQRAVKFCDALPATKVATAIEQCDVLVLPSRHDGWGVVLNEAASLGKALIASDACGGAHHLIKQGVNGFRVKACSAYELAEAMMQYCHNRDLATEHGLASRALFPEFTPTANAVRLQNALECMLIAQPPRSPQSP